MTDRILEASEKTPLTKLDNSYFFYSADCYDKSGRNISNVYGLIGFESREADKITRDPFAYILKIAKERNKDVDHVHVLSLNKV